MEFDRIVYDILCRTHSDSMATENLADIAVQISEAHRKAGLQISITDMVNSGAVINTIAAMVHSANERWWKDSRTGEPIKRNVGELLMLITSELAEAMEGDRKGLMDDKLRDRKMLEVELADALIRILDMCAGLGLDLGGAFREKMAFNAVREDHKPENRSKKGGKKY